MAFPVNSSHITFDGSSHFNSTVLDEFAYRVFPNGTLSNETSCFLIFAPYRPVLLPNGTFINSTSCDTPIDPVEVRGALGITVAVLFALSIVLCCVNLSKHGRTHLDVDKRWTLVSRRWPWYWALLSAGLGCVSGFMAIDVDRDYVQGSAIILQSVFYYCMLPTTMAAVWEMTRHWASFEERKIVDADAFHFKDADMRSKFEFYMPLIFYLFVFLTFFLSILRTWTPIRRQNLFAIESATDGRFRASSFMALIAWVVIVISATLSRHYYRRPIPLKIMLCIVLLIVRVVYNIACTFEFDISPLKYDANEGWIYGIGYVPILGVLFAMIWGGLNEGNDDLVIKQLRRERHFAESEEMGSKPKEGLPTVEDGLQALDRRRRR